MSGHGHVTPNADGSKARCGGPRICGVCAREAAAHPYVRPVEPLAKTRPITGQVVPMPCSNDDCPAYAVITPDGEPDLIDIFELYDGCVVRVTVELISAPSNSRSKESVS